MIEPDTTVIPPSRALVRLPGVDQRSTWARRYREVMRGYVDMLTTDERLSPGHLTLIRTAAVLQVRKEQLEREIAEGTASERTQMLYLSTCNSLTRALRDAGLLPTSTSLRALRKAEARRRRLRREERQRGEARKVFCDETPTSPEEAALRKEHDRLAREAQKKSWETWAEGITANLQARQERRTAQRREKKEQDEQARRAAQPSYESLKRAEKADYARRTAQQEESGK